MGGDYYIVSKRRQKLLREEYEKISPEQKRKIDC